jgi:iron complex transport system substrate-binding protein
MGMKRYHHRPMNQIDTIPYEPNSQQLTRRQFITGAGGLFGAIAAASVGLSGCGATMPTPQAAIPASPSTGAVVALDEFAGLSALSLGIKPASVFLTFGYTSAKAVFDFAGVQTALAAPDGVNLESVAALKPTTIIGVSLPTTAAVEDTLNKIAPTTVISYTAPWQEQLRVTGTATGRLEAADAFVKRLETAITALKADLASAGVAGQTVSVVGALGTDAFALSRTGSVGSLLEQVGLRRPAVQDVETEATNPFITISAERMDDHDADLIFLLSGGSYNTDPLTTSALWTTLDAVKANKVIKVAAELWFSSNAFGIDWMVRDLRAGLLNDGAVASDTDVVSRWQAFTSNQG